MNFNELMLPTSDDLIYREKDHYVWCGTMFDHNSSYYLIYSRWPKELGFQAWVTHSEVCLAKADSMLGEFKFVKLLFDRDTQPNGTWRVVHNPTVIKYHEKIYLYFVFNYGSGDWWGHR
nr:sucrase [Clostridia bacterium]